MFNRSLLGIALSMILLIAQPAGATVSYTFTFEPVITMFTTDTSVDIYATLTNTGDEQIAINFTSGYIGLDFQLTADFDLNYGAFGTDPAPGVRKHSGSQPSIFARRQRLAPMMPFIMRFLP